MLIGVLIIIAFFSGALVSFSAFYFSMKTLDRFPEKKPKAPRKARAEKSAKVNAYNIEV